MSYLIRTLLSIYLFSHFSLSSFAADLTPEKERGFFDGIEARGIGPWRGGRATTAVGVASDPRVYYMGATGGLWKTVNAGTSWENISDGFFKTAPVGDVDVAPSDSNLVIVGMGESPFRAVMSSQGDGVYKSTDAGETWTHLGFEDSKQISAVKFHPHNPDIMWVAVQGNIWAPSKGRGVYKSVDGGKNWRLVLATPNETTGAIDLKYNAANPRILFASLWDHQRKPWNVRSGGPGSGLWRSLDGGDTWTQLSDKSLPQDIGKTGIAPSPAKSGRVWALIEADEEEAGLYRSEDNGDSWVKVNTDQTLRSRSWYYMHVFAHPVDANTVFVLNRYLNESNNGGDSFNIMESIAHGDTHDIWINPENPDWMVNADDGGGQVSTDAGLTWSRQDNQPTGQYYRVTTDNMIPYNVYGGQQDNSTVALTSRGKDGNIGQENYITLGGCESAYVAIDPDNPRYSYSTCFMGFIDEYDSQTNHKRSIRAYEAQPIGLHAKEQKYRGNWNTPVLVSQHDPSVIYHGVQKVLKTSDRGYHWTEISPDLTRNETDKQEDMGRPYTNENIDVYNTLLSMAESPHDAAVLWTGSDDGLLHMTRDGGKSWQDVTPRGAERGLVNAIEPSPHDPATAYVAIFKHKSGDDRPYIYRTKNYGESWKMVAKGIPENEYVRVVREDPVREGLLYAGTERGLHVSFDAGNNWQSLQLNMPAMPITDLKVQDKDLVMSTQGRSFWIIDDISPLRQYAKAQQQDTVHLYKPSLAYHFTAVGDDAVPRPFNSPNPPVGAVFYYSLSEELDLSEQTLQVEILNSHGKIIRSLQTDEEVGNEGGEGENGYKLPAEKGINRAAWDLAVAPLSVVPGLFGADEGVGGYTVPPGTYTLRLSLGDQVQEQPVELRWDPNFNYDAAALAEQQSMVSKIYDMLDELYQSVVSIQNAKEQAEIRAQLTENVDSMKAKHEAAKALVKAIEDWEKTVINRDRSNGQNVLQHPPKLDYFLSTLLGTANGATQGLTQGIRARFNDLEPAWQAAMAARDKLIAEDLANFNANAGEAIIALPLDL